MAKKTYKMKLGLSDGTKREAEFEVPGLAYGITQGNMLVGNGEGEMVEKTPEEVREHIGAAGKDDPPNAHGNHVPETEEADNGRFLRNDNTWQKVDPESIGAAEKVHEHSTDDITSGILPPARGGTGVTSMIKLLASLLGASGTAISENADLNTYKDPGSYYAVLSVTQTLANCPVTAGIKLFVIKGYANNYISQIIIRGNSCEVYYRSCASDTWSNWSKIAGVKPTDIDAMGYITSITTGSCDGIAVGLTLRDIRTNNDELYNLFFTGKTKSENYAYIITLFLNGTGADASKVQIAVGYTHGYMAIRAFYSVNGWKPWNLQMSSILHPYFYGSTLPEPGTPGRIFYKLME